LKGSLATTSTDGDDVFVGTHLTMSALDTLDGGAGTDSILFIDDSADGTNFPAVSFSSIETVAVRNLSGDAATDPVAAVPEVATVAFQALAAGQTVVIAGVTFTAGNSGATAAEVAAAFTSATITSGSVTGGAFADIGGAAATRASITTTLGTNGYTVAAGGQVNSAVFTSNAATPTNVTDLAVTGTAVTGIDQITKIAVTTEASAAITLVINGDSVAVANGADLKADATNIANAINTYLGQVVAVVVPAVPAAALAADDHNVIVTTSSIVNIASVSGTSLVASITNEQAFAAAAAPTVTIVDGVAAVSAVAASSNPMTVDASTWEGVTTIKNFASTDAVTFSGMTEIATLSVENVISGALATTTANFDAEVTDGTADVVNVSLSGNTSAGTVTIGAGFETVNVSAAGKNTIAGLVTGAKTVNITGAGDLAITAAVAGATKIDGSAATGKLTLTSAVAKVDIDTGSGADKVTLGHAASSNHELSVSTGAGNDTVAITNLVAAAELVDSKVTIDGGAGTDTLEMKAALAKALGDLTAVEYAKKGITGFEKLAVSDVLGAVTINTERLGLNGDVTLEAGFNNAASKLDNLANNATVTIGAASTNTLTSVVKDAAVAGSGNDTINFVLSGEHAAGTITYGTLLSANVETVNINSTSDKETSLVAADTNTISTLTAVDVETINITGNVKFILTNALASTHTSLETINAAGNTAGVEISADSVVQGISITGTAKADTITGGGGSDVINAGAGNDTVNSSAGVDVITLGAGNDIFVVGDVADSGVTIATADRITDFSAGTNVIGSVRPFVYD
jgi:hypothetical protein